MRTIFSLILLSLIGLMACAQNKQMTCHESATDKFARFASDTEFVNEHQKPKIYANADTFKGNMISFDCADGTKANGYVIMSDTKMDNWIFVFQEWWGLNDNIKQWSDNLYTKLGNVNILALDMYDGKVAVDRPTAGRYMQEFNQERGDMIVRGARDYVGQSVKIGTIGWCFGGGQSLQAAITLGSQAVACVMYYGMPEEDVKRLKQLRTEVLNIWAERDKWINKEVMDKFKKNMELAGKKLTVYSYDADHAFANPSNPVFNNTAYQDALEKTLVYFRVNMK